MKNYAIKDERIREEIGKYGTQTTIIFVVALIVDICYKYFILNRPANEYASDLIIIIIAMAYFSFQLYRNGLIIASTYAGIHMSTLNEKSKRKLNKTLLINNIIFACIIGVIDIMHPDILYIVYPNNLKFSIIVTIIIEILILIIMGYLLDKFIVKIANKDTE